MEKIKAYKCFNSDMTCKDFRYKVGETYKHEGEIELCSSGFHACIKAQNCFNYYAFTSKNIVCEIEMTGEVIHGEDKSVCSEIKIIKKISWDEVLKLANSGNGNSGNRNSGDRNSGYRNSGNENSGYRNSGDRNSGDRNSGDGNSGNENSGYENSGDRNSGYRNSGNGNSGYGNSGYGNSGDGNSGNENSGYRNSGNGNSGYGNSGDRNSGYRNSGNGNSGDRNSGDRNSGYRNSGYGNSGYGNSGDGNSGNINSCNFQTGFFNSRKENKIRLFNNYIKISREEALEVTGIKICLKFKLSRYRRKINGKKKIFLMSYKKSWNNFIADLTKEEIKEIKKIPNFDVDVFYEITGQKIWKKNLK